MKEGEIIMPRWYKGQKDMPDLETAKRLVVQAENYGTSSCFVGARPLSFMQELGLFCIYELREGDPSRLACLSCVRIYNYGKQAPSEVGFGITPGGKITDPEGREYEPEELLSTKVASAGWEIHSLIVGYGKVVRQWLDEHPDG